MVDPLSMTTQIVGCIMKAASEARHNRHECARLGHLSEQTLVIVSKIERRLVTEQSLSEALNYVIDALMRAQAAINECSNSNWFGALLLYKTHTTALKQAENDLDRALSQMSLVALETTLDIQDKLISKADRTSHRRLEEPGSSAQYTSVLKTEFVEASLKLDHGFEDIKNKNQIESLSQNQGTSFINKKVKTNKEDVDGQNDEGQTPLCIASHNNQIDIVKKLIAKGANVDLPNKDGMSPLHIACSKNHCEVAKELIVNEANINLQDKNGWAALHNASQMNSIDIVKELIANDVDVNLQTKDGWSALHIASGNNHIDIVKELVTNGADVNLRENDEWTPLHVASLLNHIVIVKEMITNGANVHLRTDNGNTALHIAASCGFLHVAQELVKHGALKPARNYLQQRPYDVVCTDPLYRPYNKFIIEELKSFLKK